MFTELIPMLRHATLCLSVSGTAEELVVTVMPVPNGEGDDKGQPGLRTPLCLTGTAAELDANLPEALQTYTASYTSMAEAVAAAQATMAEAQKTIQAAAATKKLEAKDLKRKEAKPALPVTGGLFSEEEVDADN